MIKREDEKLYRFQIGINAFTESFTESFGLQTEAFIKSVE